jgi:hypothetical protein
MWELSIFRRTDDECVSSIDLPALDADAVRSILGWGPTADVGGECDVTGDALARLSRYVPLPEDRADYQLYLGEAT